MALTATATRKSFEAVCSRLSMPNPAIIGCSSYRDNIMYIVKQQPLMSTFCKNMADDLKKLGMVEQEEIIYHQKPFCYIKQWEYMSLMKSKDILQTILFVAFNFCTSSFYLMHIHLTVKIAVIFVVNSLHNLFIVLSHNF